MSSFLSKTSIIFQTKCDLLLVKFLISINLNTAINSLPNDKFSVWSKLKAYADEKINVTEKLKFVLGNIENIMEKENAGYQHFLLFP